MGIMGIKRIAKKAIRGLSVQKIPVRVPVLEGRLLEGRSALITGGTSGIGLAMAEAFVANGCNIVITGRNQGRIDGAVDRIRQSRGAHGGEVAGIIFDSSTRDEASFGRALDRAEEALGVPLDALVNNAGVIAGSSIPGTEMKDFDQAIDTNLRGAYFLSQAFAKRMVRSGMTGNILNVCSSSSLRPATNPYTVSKWGLRGLTVGLAKLLIPYGIVVNGIAPGPTATPMMVSEEDAGNYDFAEVPAGRYAAPEEVANMAVVLVSDLARMVVGDVVYITGGCGNLTFDDIGYPFPLEG